MNHLALLPLLLAACTPDVPANPSFQQDVLPILAANCVRCHGYPNLGGAPAEFRLDTYGDTVVTDGLPGAVGACGGDPDTPGSEIVICGAAGKWDRISERVQSSTLPMPPRFALDDFQIETLARWQGDRGPGHPDNHPPLMVIESITQVTNVITVRARIDDADHDLVVGNLRAVVGTQERVIGPLRSGTVELVWDVTSVPSGSYPLVATLDDGARPFESRLGTIEIEGVRR